jgi:hypothetical protein
MVRFALGGASARAGEMKFMSRSRRKERDHDSVSFDSRPEGPLSRVCGRCGATVASQPDGEPSRYCQRCGERLPGPGEPEADKTSNGTQDDPLVAVIGQAAAVVAIAAALLYGAGALDLALRLEFTHLSWESVLGQLPRDFILTTGFGQVILPAMIVGILGAILINFLANEHRGGRRIERAMQNYLLAKSGPAHFIQWAIIALILGLAEGLIALPWYLYHEHRFLHPSVVISSFEAFLIVAILSTLAGGLALVLLPRPLSDSAANKQKDLKEPSTLKPWQWTAWVGVLAGLAVIPGIAAIAADGLFPDVLICSPGFENGHLSGNLIATNGGWAYTVEYHQSNFSHDYIAAIPLASVQFEAVGRYGDCNVLNNGSRSPTPRPSPSAKP